jgi:hypothetical protein
MRLGLDVCHGNNRSALQLLEDAKFSLEGPQTTAADGALPILISLRECIESTLAELMRRRPQQEPASRSSDKIVSIGKQCGRNGLPANYFINLASNCPDLLNRLSGKKQATMPRTEIRAQFNVWSGVGLSDDWSWVAFTGSFQRQPGRTKRLVY